MKTKIASWIFCAISVFAFLFVGVSVKYNKGQPTLDKNLLRAFWDTLITPTWIIVFALVAIVFVLAYLYRRKFGNNGASLAGVITTAFLTAPVSIIIILLIMGYKLSFGSIYSYYLLLWPITAVAAAIYHKFKKRPNRREVSCIVAAAVSVPTAIASIAVFIALTKLLDTLVMIG